MSYHMENPAADEARGVLERDLLGGEIVREISLSLFHKQVRHLAARFALPEPTARAVAEHAFHAGVSR
jgi:hypothetical protein